MSAGTMRAGKIRVQVDIAPDESDPEVFVIPPSGLPRQG